MARFAALAAFYLGLTTFACAAESDFTGTWDTRTDKGWGYEITFLQKGSQVTGTYVVQNGGKGRIDRIVDGKVLLFRWEQGGCAGSGQFALSTSGIAFNGVYREDKHVGLQDASLRQGVWSGIRRVR